MICEVFDIVFFIVFKDLGLGAMIRSMVHYQVIKVQFLHRVHQLRLPMLD